MSADREFSVEAIEARLSDPPSGGFQEFRRAIAEDIAAVASLRAPAAFPLDAEQIVRLASAVAFHVVDALRHPATRTPSANDLLLRVSEAVGVPIATVNNEWGEAFPLPYGQSNPRDPVQTTKTASPAQSLGLADEA